MPGLSQGRDGRQPRHKLPCHRPCTATATRLYPTIPLCLPASSHNIRRLSHSTMSSNFEAIFNAAVARYTNQTGRDLYDHPLASKVSACDSVESVLAIFQDQAQEFDTFRNGNHKLIQWLQPVVNGLYTLSTCPALTTGVSLVSPRNHFFPTVTHAVLV